MSAVREMWQCSECGELHGYEDDAQECCRPDVKRVFVCTECESDYATEEEASACCADAEEPVPPSAEELEAAGQMRLLP